MPQKTLLIAALFSAGLAHAGTGFTTLPFTPDSLSADGKSVVGEDWNSNRLWTWNTTAGQVFIGGVTSINPGAGTAVISADGSRIGANALDPVTGKSRPSYYDVASSTWTALPDYGSATAGSGGVYGSTGSVWAMSSNGNYIAGYAYSGGSAQTNVRASIWNVQTGTLTNLGSSGLSGPNAQTRVNGISDNGLVAGGRGANNNAMVWTDLDGDGSYTTSTIANEGMVMAVSADGSWLGGIGGSATGNAAYRYNVQTKAVESLGLTNASSRGGTVSAMSADGSVIVGFEDYGAGSPQERVGFIWRAGIGIQSFDSFLASYGIDTGNTLNFATPMDVSADGLTFTGFGYPPGSSTGEGWYVSLAGLAPVPEASSFTLLMAGLGVLGLVARRRRAG